MTAFNRIFLSSSCQNDIDYKVNLSILHPIAQSYRTAILMDKQAIDSCFSDYTVHIWITCENALWWPLCGPGGPPAGGAQVWTLWMLTQQQQLQFPAGVLLVFAQLPLNLLVDPLLGLVLLR